MGKIDRIKQLVNELNKASDAYYNTGNPIMSDSEFDIKFKELQKLESETNFILSNSPTQRVGYAVAKEQKKISHEHLMLSLDKIHSVEEIREFINHKNCVASVKLDGLTVSATYINGNLTRLETRGNGEEGTDIMVHKNSIKGIPLHINHTGKYVVDGECIVPYDKFEEINVMLPEDEKFSNPRNMASGSLNLLDSNISAKRELQYVVWNVIEDSENWTDSMMINFQLAEDLGFIVVPHISFTSTKDESLESVLGLIKTLANKNYYPMDGCVFSYDDIEYGKSLGRTGHHFKHSIAYKYEVDDVETTLRNIEWTMGKTGQLTPVAIFDPVEIDGSIIEKASLHNISICKSLELGIGDTITVYKANLIIPQLRDNLTKSNKLKIPNTCPICGRKTEIVKDNESEVLMCTNPDCKGKLLGQLSHFCSKNAINIEGLSEQTLQKFIELGWVRSFPDIMNLKDHAGEMAKLNGFGKKSVDKLMAAIEKSKNTTLDRFIYALSIPLIGRSISKEIAKVCYGDEKVFISMIKSNELYKLVESIEGFGDAMYKSLTEYWKMHMDGLEYLLSYFTIEKENKSNSKVDLSGKIFVITGSLTHYKNRDELVNVIESMDGKVSGSVSSKTNYLINNDAESSSSKNKKAKQLGIPIISEQDFINLIS